jgi:hypothetical protein|nr:MAG TPA: hypothetical protein [Caudoviricetes sp.]
MKKETFNKLSLEKQVELYNEWLTDSKLEQYELYANDNDGIETLIERNFIMLSTPDIINELVRSVHYDIYDSLVTFDYEDGFRSLTEEEIKERFENKDFLCWLDGVKGINQVEEFETLLNLTKIGVKHE